MHPLKLYPQLPWNKQIFLFGLDDVIYPKKDYDLQIYYLFTQLLEYTEGRAIGNDMLEFCKTQYEQTGVFDIFDPLQKAYNLPEKYRKAFHHTYTQGRLPLKLLLFKTVLELLEALVEADKTIGLLIPGAVDVQWNKIKQTEWNGLDTKIKIFFYNELAEKFPGNPLGFVEDALGEKREAMQYIGRNALSWAQGLGLNYQDIEVYLNN